MKSIKFLLLLQLTVTTCYTQPVLQDRAKNNALITTKRITLVNGTELEYAEKGNSKGTTIIFLHGYSDAWNSFENVMQLFPGEFHLVALTQRGHGNSSKLPKGYHPKDLASDVALFIKEKKQGACIIAGHSMGGVVAQQFAIDYPELTKALILIDTDAKFADNPGFPEFIGQIMQFEKPANYSFAREFQLSTLAKPIDSVQLAIFIDESLKLPLHVWKEVGAGLLAVDLSDGLHHVQSPVLIFWGTNDAFCSRDDQQNLKKCLKNSELIIYEGTGHALHWEEPARFVADAVTFIRKLNK